MKLSIRRLVVLFVLMFPIVPLSAGCNPVNWFTQSPSFNIIIPLFGGSGGFLTPLQTTVNGIIAAAAGLTSGTTGGS